MQAGFFLVAYYIATNFFVPLLLYLFLAVYRGNLDFVFGMANFSRSLLNCHIRWILIRIID